ncbi:8602_t:CDS:2, partial [Scutellospora calospora]
MNKRKSPKYPELEKAIFSWVQELYSKLKLVTHAMIQIKAKTLSQKSPYITYYPGITKSKFSNNNQHRTSVAQKLLEDLQLQQQEFLSFVLYNRIQYNYLLALIDNIDKTPLLFNLPNNTTIDNCDANTVSIQT